MSIRTVSAPGGPAVSYATDASSIGYPHLQVTIAGKVAHVSRLELSINAHGATNEGTVTASLLADADWSAVLNKSVPDQVAPDGRLLPGVTLPSQSTYVDPKLDKPIPITIDAGFITNPTSQPQAKQLTRIFSGLVDSYKPNFGSGEVVFSIRSLAAVLIQDKVQTSTENMTTTAFIQECASRWGLSNPDIKLRSGQNPETLQNVYAQREMTGLRNVRRWDLAKYCAQVDDVQLWESNGIIHYVHPGAVERKTLSLHYGRDLVSLEGEHAIQFNKEIEVSVHSYSRRTRVSTWSKSRTAKSGKSTTTSGSSVVTTQANFGNAGSTTSSRGSTGGTKTSVNSVSGGSANSGATGSGLNESSKEKYIYDIPNLSPAQCNARAIAIWRQISMHEYQATFSFPVTPKNLPYLDVTTFFALAGCPYGEWNVKFWPRSIAHAYDLEKGWRVTVEAVNHFLAEEAV